MRQTKDSCPCGQVCSSLIEILKLNTGALVGKRKELLTRVLPPELLDSLSWGELKKLRDAYQERDENDRYQEFRQVLTCYIDSSGLIPG